MTPTRSMLARLVTITACALILEGCIFGLGTSSVTTTGNTTTYRLAFSATLTTCTPTSLPPNGSMVSCSFRLPTGQSWAVTVNLPGISPASLPPLFDPLILQVPQNAGSFAGTVAGPGGGALSITTVTGPLFADAVTQILPEAGQQLVLIDFAPGASLVSGATYQFQLDFSTTGGPPGPLPVKFLFAGKVTTGSAASATDTKAVTTYYPPLLPCASNFAAIPAITLPPAGSGTPINILPLATVTGCTNVTYNFAGAAVSTVDVIEFYNAALNHYFITWVANEIAILDAGITTKGWTRTGRSFKTWTTAQPGSSDVCRMYIPPAFGDSHYFGRGTMECNDTVVKFPQFVLEDIRFMQMILPAAGVCPANSTPVYRVFSNRADANHRYMTDRAVRDTMVAAGWLAEGDGPDQVVMCAPI